MDAALRYLGYSARTVREMETYLDECSFSEVDVYETVERLKELNLINDAQYAAEFVRTRLNAKPVSRAHLKEQLMGHGLPADTVSEALSVVDDEAELLHACAVAQKYARQFAALSEEERAGRVLKRLLSRGFGYDMARSAMERIREDGEEA